ncbi:MAG: rod shape-determining protein MreC [Spirochaetia bacterium]
MNIKERIKQRKTGLIFLSLVIVSVICLSFSTQKIVIYPKAVGHSVLGLFQEGAHAVGSFFSGSIESIRGYRSLKRDYNELEKKLTDYRSLSERSIELEYENKRFKELLGFTEKAEFKVLPAKVIAKDPENIFPTIVINKGSVNGVKQEMAVIAVQDGVEGLVGKIQEVGLKTSKILPLLDASCFVAARLQNSRYEGLVNGMGSYRETIQMLYISEHARNTIQTGDAVITSGMNSLYPAGIKIGFVDSIHGKSYETSLKLDLMPVVDFARLEYVIVITGAGAETK